MRLRARRVSPSDRLDMLNHWPIASLGMLDRHANLLRTIFDLAQVLGLIALAFVVFFSEQLDH